MAKEPHKKVGIARERPTGSPSHRRTAARRPATQATKPEQRVVIVKLVLPTWYLRVIDQDVEFMTYKVRGRFLEMLVNRWAGRISNKRSPLAPRVKPPSQTDLAPRQQFMWRCDGGVKARLEHLLVANGGIAISAFLIIATNVWLGLPALQNGR